MNKSIDCHIEHTQELSGHVMQVLLSQPEKVFKYQAGQYVEFLLPDEEPRPFSIANAPSDKVNDKAIEFHIRHSPENTYTAKLMKQIREFKKLKIKGPFGNMRYHAHPDYPLIFIAAGTGFAPCKAIIEEILQNKNHQAIYLYWAARHQSDLYWHDKLIKLAGEIDNFFYTPILSIEGRVYDAVLKHHKDFSKYHIYASGPAEMVFACQKALSEHKLNTKHFYSDWLEYAAK